MPRRAWTPPAERARAIEPDRPRNRKQTVLTNRTHTTGKAEGLTVPGKAPLAPMAAGGEVWQPKCFSRQGEGRPARGANLKNSLWFHSGFRRNCQTLRAALADQRQREGGAALVDLKAERALLQRLD